MFKSVQIKIILIIMMLAILMFVAYGAITINFIAELNSPENIVIAEEVINKNITILIIFTVSFVILSIIIIWFTTKVITKPIYKLIKSAEKMAEGEEFKNIPFYNAKGTTEIDELIHSFERITAGLKENLNEVTRQKKQFETILLHMTDGIIAFNLEGNVMHINPAAVKLLELEKKNKNDFNKIFESIDSDLNMEKIIYLENWTASEKQINIKDKYLKISFAPFKDEVERPAGVIVLIQDITEHVRLDNMRKEFIANVSHELKTPLTSVLGYAETLANSDYDA